MLHFKNLLIIAAVGVCFTALLYGNAKVLIKQSTPVNVLMTYYSPNTGTPFLNFSASPFWESCIIYDMQIDGNNLIVFTIDKHEDNIIVAFDLKLLKERWTINVGKFYREINLRPIIGVPKGNYVVSKGKLYLTNERRFLVIDIITGTLREYAQKDYISLHVPENKLDPSENKKLADTSYKEWVTVVDNYVYRLRCGSPITIDIFNIMKNKCETIQSLPYGHSVLKAFRIDNYWILLTGDGMLLFYDFNTRSVVNKLFVGAQLNINAADHVYSSLGCLKINDFIVVEANYKYCIISVPYKKVNFAVSLYGGPRFFIKAIGNSLFYYGGKFDIYRDKIIDWNIHNTELTNISTFNYQFKQYSADEFYDSVTKYKDGLFVGLTKTEICLMDKNFNVKKRYKADDLWSFFWRDTSRHVFMYYDENNISLEYIPSLNVFVMLNKTAGCVKVFKIQE